MAAVKRVYDMTRRQAQADATRQDVLDAAGRVFTSKGYAAATIEEVAAEAGVSRETVFKAVGPKRLLLRRWFERAVAGTREPVALRQQRWMRDLAETDDRRRQVEIAVAAACEIQDRAGRAIDVLRAAAHADPEIASFWDVARRQRRQDVRAVTGLIAGTGAGAGDLSRSELVDVVFALTSPELYDLFVHECGWPRERFERWLADAVTRALGEPTDDAGA